MSQCGRCGADVCECDELLRLQRENAPRKSGSLPPAQEGSREQPPPWNDLERFLFERNTETGDMRYQDAGTALYQQRTGWGAPKWPVRVAQLRESAIRAAALREAADEIEQFVMFDGLPTDAHRRGFMACKKKVVLRLRDRAAREEQG